MSHVLVLVAHGTRRAPGRSVVGEIAAAARRELPDVEVRLAHVDVQSPTLTSVMAGVRADGGRAVVVPLLLSTGYHVDVDITGAADAGLDVVAPSLAGDPVLPLIAADRLREAIGAEPAGALDAVVVAAAGSSREGARAEVAAFATAVGDLLGRPTSVGWAAGDEPSVGAAVSAAPGRVGVAVYMIGPGVFAERSRDTALAAGAVAVAEPLGADPRLVDLVVRRYRAAAAALRD